MVFQDDAHLLQIIERIVSTVGRRIDESSPMVDARLAGRLARQRDHSAAGARRPVLSIRRFRTDRHRRADLVDRAVADAADAGFLQGAVAARLNIIVSGGTGAGKTTLLNVLSSFIPTASASSRSKTPRS